MAFDQVSLFLHPPQWKRHSVADTQLKHYSGDPVWIVSDVPLEGSTGPAVQFDDLCRWFEAKGFAVFAHSATYAQFCSAAVDSALGRRAEIDVSASATKGEVTGLYCRFQLNRATPLHLEHWEAFIQELCASFALRISVSDTKSVGPDDFLTVVRNTDNWRHFAQHFGWSEPSEGGERW